MINTFPVCDLAETRTLDQLIKSQLLMQEIKINVNQY
jgi:hypothetical protein